MSLGGLTWIQIHLRLGGGGIRTFRVQVLKPVSSPVRPWLPIGPLKRGVNSPTKTVFSKSGQLEHLPGDLLDIARESKEARKLLAKGIARMPAKKALRSSVEDATYSC